MRNAPTRLDGLINADEKLALLLLYTAASDGLKRILKAGNGLALDLTDYKDISFIPLQKERDSGNPQTVVVSQALIADSYLSRSYSLCRGLRGKFSHSRSSHCITRKTASAPRYFESQIRPRDKSVLSSKVVLGFLSLPRHSLATNL